MDHPYKMEDESKNKFEDFAAYLHGENSPDLVSFSQDDTDFKAAEQINLLKEKVNLLDKLTRIEDVRKNIEIQFKRKSSSRILRYKIMRYAAGLLILLGLFGVLGKMLSDSFRSKSQDKFTEIVSSVGEIKEVVTPDGTKIWLGSNSTIKYASDFGSQNRNVIFSGEAMFDVAKDRAHPFSVAIENASIRVHGTKFILTSYSTGFENEVILLEGKVEYQIKNKSIIISAGEHMINKQQTNETFINKVNSNNYGDWVNGRVYLDNKELSGLAFMLEQWYGTRFIFEKDSLKTFKFTGLINKEKPLAYNLMIIESTNKVKFKKGENGLIITN